MFRTIKYATFLIIASILLTASEAEARGEKRVVAQGEIAELIGRKMGYKENYIENLKNVTIEPPEAWDPAKPLTKDDFNAILLRMARRNPIVEKKSPDAILDSMGFPPRDVSEDGANKVLAGEAFGKAMINSKLLLIEKLIPLPRDYAVLETDRCMVYDTKVAALIWVVVPSAPIGVGDLFPEPPVPAEPPEPHRP